MLNTEALEQATMLMPNCEYSVRSGTLNGPRVRFVRVGDMLVHRWECDNRTFTNTHTVLRTTCSRVRNACEELLRE